MLRYVKQLQVYSTKVQADHDCSHLKGSHPDYLISVVKEVGQNIKDGCF